MVYRFPQQTLQHRSRIQAVFFCKYQGLHPATIFNVVCLGDALTILKYRLWSFVFFFLLVRSVDKLESTTSLLLERRTASQTRDLRRAGPHDSTASSPFPWQLSVVLQRGAGEKEGGRERGSEAHLGFSFAFWMRHLRLHPHRGFIELHSTDPPPRVMIFAILRAHHVSFNSFFFRLL